MLKKKIKYNKNYLKFIYFQILQSLWLCLVSENFERKCKRNKI